MEPSAILTLSDLKILGEVAGSMLLGGIIGFERELRHQAAGLRTHMIVCGASAMLVVFSNHLINDFVRAFPDGSVRTDPTHVIVAIVTGVAFVGAGTIIQRGGTKEGPKGLTTAASLLFTAGIGIGIATEKFAVSVALTLLLVAVTWGLGCFEKRFFGRPPQEED